MLAQQILAHASPATPRERSARARPAGWRAALVTAVAAGLLGCGAGEGGVITVPCDESRCNTTCVAEGSPSGSCREDMCVCRPAVDVPPGASGGLSSGGAVHRESGRFQVDVSVAPVPLAGERAAGRRDVELGLQPGNDPERRAPAP